MRRPLWINLKTEKVIQPLHLLLQDLLAGLDAAVGFAKGFQANYRLSGHLGAFVFA
nr:hypothetical protein [uncultured Brevundimonas sp.]